MLLNLFLRLKTCGSSVSFAKEQTLLNDEIRAKRHLAEEGRRAAYKTLARQNFEENTIMRNTFDNIFSATLVILKDEWKNNKDVRVSR